MYRQFLNLSCPHACNVSVSVLYQILILHILYYDNSKRRPHITELLNIAVDQTNQIVEAKSEILNRPASIWLHAGGDEDNVADDFLSDFVRGLSPNVIIFSRLCEKVYLSKATRVIRFVIILLAISVMIYEVGHRNVEVIYVP